MSARPGEWHLVGHESDPVPGSPSQVGTEGRHSTAVADTISDQIARLRRLAEPDEALVGHYAEGLQESCSDLADHLAKVEDRFRSTGAALTGFEGDLRTART